MLGVPSKACASLPPKRLWARRKGIDCRGKNKVWTLEGNIVAHAVTSVRPTVPTQVLGGIAQGRKVVTAVEVKGPGRTREGADHQLFGPGSRNKNKNKQGGK